MEYSIERIDAEHRLTEKFIHLVAEGNSPFQAVMALVGPDFTRDDAAYQLGVWEHDRDIQHRIDQLILKKQKLHTNIRERVAERLLSMAFSDMRNYFTVDGPKPINNWSQSESYAVKKIKFSETTDPFGNVTKNMELDFHDVYRALGVLGALFPEKLADIVKVSKGDVKKLREMSKEELTALHKELLAG